MKPKISHQEIEALRVAARVVVRELGLLADAYHDVGITLAERHLLTELSQASSLTASTIAERLLLEKSTVSRLVAKAMQKGFVAYSVDTNDKRRRCLEITQAGLKTLAAIEPIAQAQVKEALLTLTQEEIQIVQLGMKLFAKGLGNARMQKQVQHA